ncbi:peroxidase-related enzyme [Halobacillus yeomjeoni]|uniref:carboxymuconolactone decarboxylase family protein n=1 Tax=Halobacillus yeomjeoni TaxID=311194 RepID=UPI001CD2DE56|nr:peroxidase-related enzyme [Halobacillus yeomjeoni]MCA0985333.1 peroxidase-related enzyme [Halobacillus yeomjeoni]
MPWIKPMKQSAMKEMQTKNQSPDPAPLFNRLLANDPELYDAFLPLQEAIKGTSLSEELRETVITFVSMKNGCEYCTKSHKELLENLIGREDTLQWLENYEESDMEEEWKAVLNYADKLIAKPVKVTKGDVQRLKDFGYDEKAIVQLNQTIAYTSYTNQLSMGLGL